MTEEYYVGEIFIDEVPKEAVYWCDEHNYYLNNIEPLDGHQRIQIFEIPEPTAEQRRTEFLNKFFKVGDIGYYRKTPKGYQSAIESINTAFNICVKTGGLPANTLIFYPEPDFTSAEQCTEEWLVAHQIKLPAMNELEFSSLYIAFVSAWNNEEH